MERKIIDRSPFETIDKPGVGWLVRLAAWVGRERKPSLKLGVCGEHGGDPESIAFFHMAGLDYVSCSAFRVPIARVAAAQAAISDSDEHSLEPTMTAELGLVLIGPPGVGKGTQATRLRDEFGLAHIATGDLLREHRARGTQLGQQATAYMTNGELVPDSLVVAMVQERLTASPRFLLDGFPRTLPQAHALTHVLKLKGSQLTAAVLVEAPDDVVVERIAGREDGRDDDTPETVRKRLDVFHRATAPVIHYYEALGLLHRIDAARPIADVYADARRLLGALSEASQKTMTTRPRTPRASIVL